MLSRNFTRTIATIILTATFVFSTTYAGAFQLWEQDAGGAEDYHAGAAAEADTAATEFYNPAGITQIKHQQISFGGALIAVETNYTGSVSPIPEIPFYNTTVTNAAGDTTTIVPNFHYVFPFRDHWAFGFGITTPFGLETQYENIYPTNNLATKTELATININPSIAYEINHYLSVGIGFDELYGQAIYNSNLQLKVPFLGLLPGDPIRSKLDGWAPGYNAGILITATPTTRIGLSYRSEIRVSATGTSSSQLLLTPTVISNSNTAAVFPLPPTTILSLYHDVNSRLSLMGSAFYTQWSVFKELVINNLATPINQSTTLALNEDYRNTWNFAVGGKYKITHTIALAAGFGHDDTPTQLGMRDIRLPDNNRYAAALGVDIQPTPGFRWSMGWTHFFVTTTPINNVNSNDPSQTTPGAEPPISIGNSTGAVNVYGIEFTVDI